MKQLYESILGSTNSGAKSVIQKWWQKYFADFDKEIGGASIQQINGKWYIVFDNMSSSAYQYIITFSKENGANALNEMPKQLKGFLRKLIIDFDKLYNVQMLFSFINHMNIDLSNFDYSEGVFSIIDPQLCFYHCEDCQLTGLPKYTHNYCVTSEASYFTMIKVKDNLCQFENRDPVLSLKNCVSRVMKNSDIHVYQFPYKEFIKILIEEYNIPLDRKNIGQPYKDYWKNIYRVKGDKCVLCKQLTEYLDNFAKNNKVDKLFYLGSYLKNEESPKLHNQTGSHLIEKDKDGWFINVKVI